MAKTSITDPIWVTKIDHPDHPGKIGVSICPGKKSPSVFGGMWHRDLELDLTAIQRDFDPTAIVTLMIDNELSANKVPNFWAGRPLSWDEMVPSPDPGYDGT